MKDNPSDNTGNLVLSYRALRRAMGILGIALPIILMLGSWFYLDCHRLEMSISNYYHTEMRNFFVVILSSFGIFLFLYSPKGAAWKADRIASKIAGALGLLVVFFPTNTSGKDICGRCDCIDIHHFDTTQYVHLPSAILFFLTLAYFSIFLFTRTDKPVISAEKKKRNVIYRICGWIMVACVLALVPYFFKAVRPWMDEHFFMFWMETIALWAFGTSWLVKGEVILSDK